MLRASMLKKTTVVAVRSRCSPSPPARTARTTRSGSLGSGSSGGAGSGQTYKIGFQGALSGDNQQLGINEVNAVKLAVKQANEKGDLRLQARRPHL